MHITGKWFTHPTIHISITPAPLANIRTCSAKIVPKLD